MDIYAYLKKDHKKVSALFKKIIASKTAAARLKVYQELKKELTLHADTENATFYNALRKHSKSKPEASHGKEEHDEIKAAISKLDKIAAKDSKWLVQLGELKHTVEHHVSDEENEMFAVAKKVISNKRAQELALEMDAMKNKKLGLKAKKSTSFTRQLINRVEDMFK